MKKISLIFYVLIFLPIVGLAQNAPAKNNTEKNQNAKESSSNEEMQKNADKIAAEVQSGGNDNLDQVLLALKSNDSFKNMMDVKDAHLRLGLQFDEFKNKYKNATSKDEKLVLLKNIDASFKSNYRRTKEVLENNKENLSDQSKSFLQKNLDFYTVSMDKFKMFMEQNK